MDGFGTSLHVCALSIDSLGASGESLGGLAPPLALESKLSLAVGLVGRSGVGEEPNGRRRKEGEVGDDDERAPSWRNPE